MSKDHAFRQTLLSLLMYCAAFVAVLALPGSVAAHDKPAPAATPDKSAVTAATPAPPAPAVIVPAQTPTPTPTPSPTPDPQKDQGLDEPSIGDPLLQDETPVEDPAKQPTTDTDKAFVSSDYKETHSEIEGGGRISAEPNAIPYDYTAPTNAPYPCERVVKASVVAFDQVFFWNRLGAVQPQGMIYALRHNVVPIDWRKGLVPGNVRLRGDKRPRPLVLRMNVGDCLQIDFQNLLNPTPVDEEQPATRHASIHVVGLQAVNDIKDDGSNVGRNPSPPGGLVPPGGRTTYTLYADGSAKEGNHLMYSTAATTTGEGNGGQIPPGLFGAVNVEPRGAEWYRSQLTHNDLRLATVGYTAFNQPIINYDATYPWWHRYRGLPILKIMNRRNIIVHQDLNAIITGPERGVFDPALFPSSPTAPNRHWPFREFTIIYHDEIGAVQAFPQFEDGHPSNLEFTLHGSRDAFAINYGTAGIGAEILANRLGVGPMKDCQECLFEEFFLSAWAVGDPAMVVDRPANAPCDPHSIRDGRCSGSEKYPIYDVPPGYKAQKAFYPADPSNVHHSYLGDHTKMRILHAGPKEHHIHHLHAHQWLKSADSDVSSYNDSQALGPGSGMSLEITHNGSGNRNLTVGDSIFHCHFYPHFAQGMWELWRTHDVFEEGTRLDFWGRPAFGSRALPDAEIKRGTPIPAVVPLPGGAAANKAKYVMPPMPQAKAEIVDGQVQVTGDGNPGFPFFVPAVAGHRPPHPPLDTQFDAGLPRHIILNAAVVEEHHTRLNFDKVIAKITAQELEEAGEKYEKFAMLYHEQPTHESRMTDNTPGFFMTNGRPRVAGAPYADPCVSDRFDKEGRPIFTVSKVGEDRTYKGVMFQFDMKINKKGWHFPQSRIESLWEDWQDIIEERRAPEPLFFRANSDDCVTFYHANLIPKIYVQDDFQVRTPTDIVGQHIHLVKFDVTASDGAGNGWNYEDGTFGPQEVEHRIDEINAIGGIFTSQGDIFLPPLNEQRRLEIQKHPTFGQPTQVTLQRWYVDPVKDRDGNDRTLRTVFTHDHFGPSTHQQTGLYAGLVVEPRGSVWRENEAPGNLLGGAGIRLRDDGGPTSFAAVIIPPDETLSYREFMLEYQDFHLAYEEGFGGTAENPHADPKGAINPPGRNEIPLPRMIMSGPPFDKETALLKPPVDGECPDGEPAPCPEIVSADDPGTFSVNYRNEPIALRVRNPDTNTQADGDQGDLSLAYASIERKDPRLNTLGPYPPLVPGMGIYDPYTPLLRANENDRVQVRILVGAHEEGHNFTIHGVKWLFEPSDPDSGYRNSQMTGISEKFDFILAGNPPDGAPGNEFRADYLYKPGASVDDQWNGLWGIMRVYKAGTAGRGTETNMPGMPQNDVPPFELPSNRASTTIAAKGAPETATVEGEETALPEFIGPCPRRARRQHYNVAAYLARDILPERRLEFDGQNGYSFTVKDNDPDSPTSGDTETGPLNDPTAILFVDQDNDIDPETKMYKRQRVEPLILRANAGDCITVTLTNNLPDKPVDLPGYNTMPMIVDYFNANQVVPSRRVGLHPQLVHYDVTTSDGMNVGLNPIQTVGPGEEPKTYTWYAGDVGIELSTNTWRGTPVEFGATNLVSSDPIKHSNKSAIGSLIIEPYNSSWAVDEDSTHSAMIYMPVDPSVDHCAGCPVPVEGFREFVLQFQNDINMRFGSGRPVPNLAEAEDPEDSAQKAINYRTEPFWTRLCYWPALRLTGNDPPIPAHQCPASDAKQTRALDMTNSLHNNQIGGLDPVTPIFTAEAGQNVRFRVLHSGGHARNNVFMVHGHMWQEMPYKDGSNSTVIGFKQDSPWHGSQWGHGPSNHFDVVIQSAGGAAQVPGDYLYRTFQSWQFDGGIWGLFRVERHVVDPPCCDEIYYY
jgi:hypothetical protein